MVSEFIIKTTIARSPYLKSSTYYYLLLETKNLSISVMVNELDLWTETILLSEIMKENRVEKKRY